MLYLFRVDDGGHFEDERDEPLTEGQIFTQVNMTYRVDEVLPGDHLYAAVYLITHVGGPGTSGGL